MKTPRLLALLCTTLGLVVGGIFCRMSSAADSDELSKVWVHLRNSDRREWTEFPEQSDGVLLERRFQAAKNSIEATLSLQQYDVKQVWRVSVNGKSLGELVRDENHMRSYFSVPAGLLKDGENDLRIEPASRAVKDTDDIRVGRIRIELQPLNSLLRACRLTVKVLDETYSPIPARITILDASAPEYGGCLQTVGAESDDEIAVRPGTVFTANGKAVIGLPKGEFTLLASRGFEYSLWKADIKNTGSADIEVMLPIDRQVNTLGYVACDTHVHTLTHSGHGDATIKERLITLAGEGIELPIATDHNKHIDFAPIAEELKLRRYMTPVVGNEVTTSVGHFNIFPVQAGARVVDHKRSDWGGIFREIYQTPGVGVAILNHARDLHSGVRPFGPKLHNAVIGENIAGWPMRFNAMEVVNSGATQNDPLRLFHDWMATLNRGLSVTPIGSSDSHDVARHFVGQARTYIRCDDEDASKIDVKAAVESVQRGRVLVSYGLLADIWVDDKFQSGDLATGYSDSVRVRAEVRAPHWSHADQVQLFANGRLIESVSIDVKPSKDPKARDRQFVWKHEWVLPRPSHDQHLVVIAIGPGIAGSFWKTAKPYQATSPDWTSRVIGCSGAVWLDGDGNQHKSAAREYAERLVELSGKDGLKLLKSLSKFDSAIASQAAHVYQAAGGSLKSAEFQAALQSAPEHVREGIQAYLEAVRETEVAKAESP